MVGGSLNLGKSHQGKGKPRDGARHQGKSDPAEVGSHELITREVRDTGCLYNVYTEG